jgi:hypothetical protein
MAKTILKNLAVALLILFPSGAYGQCPPTHCDNPVPLDAREAQIRSILLSNSISINKQPPCTKVGGLLLSTALQLVEFQKSFGFALTLSGGSEPHTEDRSPFSHGRGWKVDILDNNRPLDPQLSTLSDFIFLRSDFAGTDVSEGGVRQLYITRAIVPTGVTDAIEFPLATSPPGFNRCATHWDMLFNNFSIELSRDGEAIPAQAVITLMMGDSVQIGAKAKDVAGNDIGLTQTDFDWSSSAPEIASVDATGTVNANKEGSVGIFAEQGFFQVVAVQVVRPPQPPVAPGGTWVWDTTANGGTGAWLWQPNISQPPGSNQNPPSPPPAPGACPSNASIAGPCWIWDPNANNGMGAWIFIPHQGGGSTTATWPVTPVSSYDPNDITGLPGVGNARHLTNTSPLTYLIQFENLATATAPAQQVTVTDALNIASFDLSTVALGPIAFAGQVVTPPAVPLVALGKFSTDLDLRPSTNLIVRVAASLDVPSGVLSWSMTSLDAATLQPPADPLAGFLPPGVGGSVSLIVNAKGSLPSGTTVSDQAFIVFDANPAIATPVWSNTLDSTAPSSAVKALPATESSANFTVAWQGSDTSSGIQDFTVFASDNGGSFSVWMANTTANSATFFGQWGHTYAFYSIARDRVGNIESAKTIAETTTQVIPDPVPPVSTAALSPQPNAAGWNNSNVTVNLASFDNPGGTGVKQISYSATGAQPIASTTVPAATTSFQVSTEGITTIAFFGTDNAGNVETPKTLTVELDKTPPSIAGSRTPLPNANGWNNTDVTVSFVCADTLSGLASGSPPPPTVLSTEAANQSVSGVCQDLAGNSSSTTVSGINVDKTPPTVTCSVSPNVLWPPNGDLVPVNAYVTVTDLLSGSAGFNLVSVTSSEPDSGLGDIQGFVAGTPSVSGQLRAQRLGSGNGRVYTLTYSGLDHAGNPAACTTTVTVPHDQGH